MTTYSPILGIVQVAPGQNSKETTINNAVAALEAAGNTSLTVTFSGSDVTLTAAQFSSSIRFASVSNASTLNLKLPHLTTAGSTMKRLFIIYNGGSAVLTVKSDAGSGATAAVGIGATAILYFDGVDVTTVISTAVNNGIIVKQGTTITDSAVLALTFADGFFVATDTSAGAVTISPGTKIVPASGFVVSNGTSLTAGTPGSSLSFGSGTLSVTSITAGLVSSNGTILEPTTLGSNLSWSGGTLSLTGVELSANKNAANGYAGLDSGGKVAYAQLPAALAEAFYFAGAWNATTNSPTLTSGSGTAGSCYVVSVAGTTTLDGFSQWNVGDKAIFDGNTTKWERIEGDTTEVVSVAGRTGAVTLSTSDVSGLSAFATQTVPASGLVVSNGTSLVAGGIGAGLAYSGGTLSVAALTAGLVSSNGTIHQATTLGSNLAYSAGTLSLSGVELSANKNVNSGYAGLDASGYVPFARLQPEAQNFPLAISHPGTMTNSEVVMIVPVNQTLTLPTSLTGSYLVINNTTTDVPAATTTLTLATLHSGTWTNRGTLSVNTGGTMTISGAPVADVTLVPGDGVRITGQATADTGFKNFGVAVMLKKVDG